MLKEQFSMSGATKSQLDKYAADFADIYQSEKAKRVELERKNRQIARYADDLKSTLNDLKSAHTELQDSYLDTIQRLVMAAEYRDEDTAKHIVRIGKYCQLIAQKLDYSPEDIEKLYYASALHDIGKIGIPDVILNKPGRLTPGEFDVIKSHTSIGGRILSGSRSEILKLGERIALSHHEKWNGTGYPLGLKESDIPLEGRIVAIADVFDALTSERQYKKAFSIEDSVRIITEEKGTHFDPRITDIFLGNVEEVKRIKESVDEDNSTLELMDFKIS